MATQSIKNLQPFFSHDANSRNSDKMIRLRLKCGVAGYGVYYMLIERLRCCENFKADLDYEVLAYDIDCDIALIKTVIEDFGLFEIIDGQFHSIELTKKMEAMEEARLHKQELARKAAEARWNRRNDNNDRGDDFGYPEQSANDTPPISGSGLHQELSALKNNNEWLTSIKNEFNLSEDELSAFLDRFYANCIKNGMKNGHASLKDAAKHCCSYIRKIQNANSKSQPTSTVSPVTDKLSPVETERLKEFNQRHEMKKLNKKIDNSQSGDNLFRNRGYNPADCNNSVRCLYDPEWVRNNPPTHPEWIGRFPGRETIEFVEAQLKEAVGV